MEDEKALMVLKDVFGFDSFRGPQREIIEHIIAGKNALVLMPPASGKSLCYQIPAIARDGLGIVISPLIALMTDQFAALQSKGVRAATLHSLMSADQVTQVEQRVRAQELDLLYVAPERLVTARFLELLDTAKLAPFAIDEAHCIHQGHEFRPEYLDLDIIPQRYPHVPRIALTATADAQTQEVMTYLDVGREASFQNRGASPQPATA
jgi:ATP-dependent DNA helicase RecQ